MSRIILFYAIGITSPYLLHLVPTPEERPVGKQCRFVPDVSKHQDDQGLGAYAQGEGVPKDSAYSYLACICTKAPGSLLLRTSFRSLAPTLEGGAPASPLEMSKRQGGGFVSY